MTTTRRCLAVGLLWLGFAAWSVVPASAQGAPADADYAGLRGAPTIASPGVSGSPGAATGPLGLVLAASGERTVAPAAASVPTQVLPSQVSGAVAGTAQARVQGLAFTGADIVTLVAFGLGAIVLGIVLNRRSRPRSLANQ